MNYKNVIALFIIGTYSLNGIPDSRILVQPHKNIETIKEQFTTSKPHIYFDLHEVLVKRNILKGLYNFYFKHLTTWQERAYFMKYLVSAIFNKKLLCEIRLLMKDKHNPARRVAENYYNLIGKYHNQNLRDCFMVISKEIYSVDDEVIEILHALKTQDYPIYLFSNAGYESIEYLKKDPRFDKLFGSQGFFTRNSINNEPQELYTDSKPYPLSYEKALAYHEAHKDNAIMIDDSHKKIKDCNWAARIWYKNATHLKTALETLGIMA